MEGKLKAKIFLFLFTLFSSSLLFSVDSDSADRIIPDNYEVRREFKDIIFGSNSDIEKQKISVTESFLTGKLVRFSVLNKESAYYFLFINGDMESFNAVSPGTYIIKRNKKNGQIEQVKIFLKEAKDTYVKITSEKGKTLLEMMFYGSIIYRDIIIPVSLDELVLSPFDRIVELSEYMIDWSFLSSSYDKDENRKLKNISSSITERLSSLHDSDDGAQDKNGNFIFIETMSRQNGTSGFNCSGFVKWICDGLYFASEKKLMDVETLKKKNIDKRATLLNSILENERDPYFGLDWTRNIAIKISGLRLGEGEKIDPSSVDIRDYPFRRYIDDRGYPVSDLKSIMYYDAKKEPGYFYLASVNGDFGDDPVLRQHFHVAALFPLFSYNGEFAPAVYERNRSTDIDEFIERYKNNYVHMVKIRADSAYILPDTSAD